MRYNSESDQAQHMMRGNSSVFEDIKISLGFFIAAPKS